MVVGRVEEAAGRIGEMVEDRVGEVAGGDEPALVERRLVQREQPVGEVGVVLEDALAAGPAVLPRPTEPAVGADAARRGSGRPPRSPRRHVARLVERPTGLGERRDRQPVPGGQRLVVAGRLGTRLTAGEQPRPGSSSSA